MQLLYFTYGLDVGSGLLVVLELNPYFPQDTWEEEVVEDLEYHGEVGFLVGLGGGRDPLAWHLLGDAGGAGGGLQGPARHGPGP